MVVVYIFEHEAHVITGNGNQVNLRKVCKKYLCTYFWQDLAVRQNLDHLHFFQPMTSQLLYISWSSVLQLVERVFRWLKFLSTAVRSYTEATKRT
jgi:hypothetical protein